MEYEIQPIIRWPEGWDRFNHDGKYSPFKADWRSTMELLERELDYLGARQVTFQIDVKDGDIRRDGMLRADARVDYPGVILGFETKKFGGLSYPCNAFTGRWREPGWQHNIRAIALGLEALRKVERYGIAERGQQYAGFKELGSGMAMGRMDEDSAWDILIAGSGVEGIDGPSSADELFRMAAKIHHPDAGGDPAYFKLLVEARDVLEGN